MAARKPKLPPPNQQQQQLPDPHEMEKMMKSRIPPLRTFVVKRVSNLREYDEVTVEAHTYCDTDAGSLAFTRFEYSQHYGRVMQHYYMMMAPRTWLDVRELTTELDVRPS